MFMDKVFDNTFTDLFVEELSMKIKYKLWNLACIRNAQVLMDRRLLLHRGRTAKCRYIHILSRYWKVFDYQASETTSQGGGKSE